MKYSRLSFNAGQMKGSYLSSSSEMKTTDLIVVCGSRQFPVHKERLRQVSPTFEAILESLDGGECVDVNNNDSAEMRKVQDRVIVDNVSGQVFEKILNFIYNGSIEFSDDCVKILKASDLYQVSSIHLQNEYSESKMFLSLSDFQPEGGL